MTAINDISDLIRVLQEHPEWQQALRGIILDEDLTRLPKQVDQRFNQMDERFNQVDQRFKQVDERFDQVDERFNQVDQRFKQVDERFDQVDERFNQFKSEVDERFNQVDTQIEQFKTEVNQRFNQTNGRLDNMAGTNYELKVEKNIRSIAPQQMGLRSARVVHGTLSGMDPNLQQAIEQAADNGAVTWEEASALMAADLIFEARTRTEGTPVHVVAETSITAGEQDVTRTRDRAQTLGKVLGAATTPAVVCSRIDGPTRSLAGKENVAVALLPE